MKWEYEICQLKDANLIGEKATLKLRGDEGWELVQVTTLKEHKIGCYATDWITYYFKREKIDG